MAAREDGKLLESKVNVNVACFILLSLHVPHDICSGNCKVYITLIIFQWKKNFFAFLLALNVRLVICDGETVQKKLLVLYIYITKVGN